MTTTASVLASLERAAGDLLASPSVAAQLSLEDLDRAARATMTIEAALVAEVGRRERAIDKEAALLRANAIRAQREGVDSRT